MQAQDLRIGNLVLYDYDGRPVGMQVEYISKDLDGYSGYHLGLSSPGGGEIRITCLLDRDYVTPIPLTPEWLEKFGAKNVDFYGGHVIELKLISGRAARLIIKSDLMVALHDGRKSIYIGIVPHVHLLQNLIFALTGEELTR